MIPRQYMSVRFFPWWSMLNSDQVVGLIGMMNSIFKSKIQINSFVEIGSHLGESSTIFLSFDQIKTMYCIDPWNQDKIFEEIFDERLKPFIDSGRCKKIKTVSLLGSNNFLDSSIDMVYIDGNHEYEYVIQDINIWYPKIKQKGILSGHDYSDYHPGSKRAIDEFIQSHNLTLNTFIDSSWYVIKE